MDRLLAEVFEVGGMAGEKVGEFDYHKAVMVDEVGELDGVGELGGVFEGLIHEEADAGDIFLDVGVGGEVAGCVGGVGTPKGSFRVRRGRFRRGRPGPGRCDSSPGARRRFGDG
jgi:hypothetical protein